MVYPIPLSTTSLSRGLQSWSPLEREVCHQADALLTLLA